MLIGGNNIVNFPACFISNDSVFSTHEECRGGDKKCWMKQTSWSANREKICISRWKQGPFYPHWFYKRTMWMTKSKHTVILTVWSRPLMPRLFSAFLNGGVGRSMRLRGGERLSKSKRFFLTSDWLEQLMYYSHTNRITYKRARQDDWDSFIWKEDQLLKQQREA